MYSDAAGAAQDGAQARRADFPLWPSTIELHKASRTLDLVWGERQRTLSHREMRLACRCAGCENARRSGSAIGVKEDVELLRIECVAESGLRFFFSDGHDRGIYPWTYLFGLAFARG